MSICNTTVYVDDIPSFWNFVFLFDFRKFLIQLSTQNKGELRNFFGINAAIKSYSMSIFLAITVVEDDAQTT